MNSIPKTTLPDGRVIAHMNASETWLIHDEIFREKIYDQLNVNLSDDATVVDIGSNIGLFLLYATDHYQRLNYFCFEPIPDTFRVLSHNRQLIRDAGHRVTLNNQGVWKKKSTAIFRHLPRFSCSSTMCPDDSEEQSQRALDFTLNAFDQHPSRLLAGLLKCLPNFVRVLIAKLLMKHHAKHQTIECELTSISDILRDHQLDQVDYLKVDAEGAEIEILEAVSEDDWKKIKQIVVETHRGDESMQHVEAILRKHGFETSTGFSQSSPADKMVYGTRACVIDPSISSASAEMA
jgi:FkbM family methyltransferase